MNWIQTIAGNLEAEYNQKRKDGMDVIEAYEYVLANTCAGPKPLQIFAASISTELKAARMSA